MPYGKRKKVAVKRGNKMKNIKIIMIEDYVFALRMGKDENTDQEIIASSNFAYNVFSSQGKMTAKQLEKGQAIQKDIYNGNYNYLIPKEPNATWG